MSSRDMSMDTTMEDDESFVSNTNATIYGASYLSVRTESLISGPNIPNLSSTSEDYCHQQQSSTAAGGDSGDTSDDLIVYSSASSNWFKNNNNNQGEVRIFNVDFRALLSMSPRPGMRMNMNIDNDRPLVEVKLENPTDFPMDNNAFNAMTARQLQMQQFRQQQIAAMSSSYAQNINQFRPMSSLQIPQVQSVLNMGMARASPVKVEGFRELMGGDYNKNSSI